MSNGQGGSPWSPGGSSTPDWAALAEEEERKRARRRRNFLIGGGGLAALAIAGIVAVAVVSEGGGDPSDEPSRSLPSPEDLPSSPGQAEPSFEQNRPPAPPEDYLKDPEKDSAPLSEDTLFPDEHVTVNGRQYVQAATDGTTDCDTATQGGLGAVLEEQGCSEMFRATYERSGLAFTVGIAVFDSEGAAAAVKAGYQPNVAALPGGDVPSYCRTVICRTTVNAVGRYTFFTIAGHTDGQPADETDEAAKQTALDGSHFGYGRLIQRGEDQAEADARSKG